MFPSHFQNIAASLPRIKQSVKEGAVNRIGIAVNGVEKLFKFFRQNEPFSGSQFIFGDSGRRIASVPSPLNRFVIHMTQQRQSLIGSGNAVLVAQVYYQRFNVLRLQFRNPFPRPMGKTPFEKADIVPKRFYDVCSLAYRSTYS